MPATVSILKRIGVYTDSPQFRQRLGLRLPVEDVRFA